MSDSEEFAFPLLVPSLVLVCRWHSLPDLVDQLSLHFSVSCGSNANISSVAYTIQFGIPLFQDEYKMHYTQFSFK